MSSFIDVFVYIYLFSSFHSFFCIHFFNSMNDIFVIISNKLFVSHSNVLVNIEIRTDRQLRKTDNPERQWKKQKEIRPYRQRRIERIRVGRVKARVTYREKEESTAGSNFIKVGIDRLWGVSSPRAVQVKIVQESHSVWCSPRARLKVIQPCAHEQTDFTNSGALQYVLCLTGWCVSRGRCARVTWSSRGIISQDLKTGPESLLVLFFFILHIITSLRSSV